MSAYPESPQRALDLLLRACPELDTAWQSLAAISQSRNAEDIGLYVVTGQLILPAVAHLLGDASFANLPQQDPDFAALPALGSNEATDFLNRMYAVLDSWASSPNDYIQGVVYVEFIESGYASLSVEDLTRHAWPQLKRLQQSANPR
jgi:hypothetical protein